MNAKIRLMIGELYYVRKYFAGYMRHLIEVWYRLARNKEIDLLETLSHNSIIFIYRAYDRNRKGA